MVAGRGLRMVPWDRSAGREAAVDADTPDSDHMKLLRPGAALAAAIALTLGAAAALTAHDFWLVPNAFRLGSGEQLEVRGQTSSAFPTSEGAVAPERIAEARVLGATGESAIGDISVAGSSLMLRHRPSGAGQRVVAVTIHPRLVRMSPGDLREYLVLEGAPELLERYEREGGLPTDSITRRFAKYAKTIVEVGSGGPRAFARVAGHPSELVPLRDPAGLAPGDTLPVLYLHQGRPLTGAHVHAGSVPSEGSGQAESAATLVSDAEGIVRVPIGRAGLWNVRALFVTPVDAGPGADWDTHWVTLVFGVG
jgi:hypothetical protein